MTPEVTTVAPPDAVAAGEQISSQLARFTTQLQLSEVPQDVQVRAKHLILDSVGIAYASASYRFSSVALAALEELSGPAGVSGAPVIGHGRGLSLRDAALMNGVLIHGLDFDDTHSRSVVHSTTSAFPCTLGIADRDGASGEELLAAYIAAMETTTRIGSVAKGGFHQVGFHPTGLVGAFGCALGAARLLKLDVERSIHAQGIALSMASGSLEFLEDGAWTKRLHPGWAAVAGTTAATFAKHGYIGSRAAYEGRFGLFASHLGERMKDAEIGLATQGLMTQWEINEVAVKPLAACHFTHAPADAALALHAQFGLEPRDIARVVVLVPQQVVKVVCEPVANKKKPQNSYDAQFSIPYIVATCLVKGRFTLDELEDDALADDAVLALARRVDYEIDEASTFPRHYTGEVIIETTDGRRLRHREAINRGSADRPLSNAEIVAKFHGNAGRALTREAAQRVAGAILNLEQHGARQLGDVLAAPPAR